MRHGAYGVRLLGMSRRYPFPCSVSIWYSGKFRRALRRVLICLFILLFNMFLSVLFISTGHSSWTISSLDTKCLGLPISSRIILNPESIVTHSWSFMYIFRSFSSTFMPFCMKTLVGTVGEFVATFSVFICFAWEWENTKVAIIR